MSYAHLRNIYLRSLTEAADDDEEEKKRKEEEEKEKQKAKEAEEKEKEEKQQEEAEEDEQETDEEGDDSVDTANDGDDAGTAPGSDEGESEPTPAADTGGPGGEEDPDAEIDPDSVTDVDGSSGADDFDMGDGEDDGENPDGLPSADYDGSSDESDDNAETNIQVNILKLSKLDRALAKRTCFDYFSSLRSTIQTALNMIDRNEQVLDADLRVSATRDLNDYAAKVQGYLQYKFPTVNYEEAMTAYYTFVQEINRIIETVRKNGITGTGRRKTDKENKDNGRSKTKE